MAVIKPVTLVERAAAILADDALKIALKRRNVLVVGLGRGREVVGAFGPHFVEIAVQVGHPLLVEGHTLLGHFLRLPGPIAVEVEIIVRKTPAGPGLAVFTGKRRGVAQPAMHLVVPVHVAVVPVGVKARVKNDHAGFQNFGRNRKGSFRFGGHEQAVQHLHKRLGANGFVAMHVVTQPLNRRHRLPRRLPVEQANAAEVIGSDFVNTGHVGFAGHHDYGELAALVGGAVGNQFHAAGGLPGHLFGVGHNAVLGRKSFAGGISQKLGWAGNGSLRE